MVLLCVFGIGRGRGEEESKWVGRFDVPGSFAIDVSSFPPSCRAAEFNEASALRAMSRGS